VGANYFGRESMATTVSIYGLGIYTLCFVSERDPLERLKLSKSVQGSR